MTSDFQLAKSKACSRRKRPVSKAVLEDDVGVLDELIGQVRDAVHKQMQSEAAAGHTFFMVCKCQTDVEFAKGFVPIVTRDGGDVMVSAVVCTECGHAQYFEDGRLVWLDLDA